MKYLSRVLTALHQSLNDLWYGPERPDGTGREIDSSLLEALRTGGTSLLVRKKERNPYKKL